MITVGMEQIGWSDLMSTSISLYGSHDVQLHGLDLCVDNSFKLKSRKHMEIGLTL